MMDAKEALKELEDLTVDYGNRNEEQIARLDEAIDMAMDALRAQAERTEERTETHGVCLDAIDRQATIDALEKVAELFPWRVPGNRDSYDRYNEAWNDAIGRAEIEIEKLPSAQPEHTSNNDCNGCKFVGCYDTDFPCANCIRKNKDYYAPERRTDGN